MNLDQQKMNIDIHPLFIRYVSPLVTCILLFILYFILCLFFIHPLHPHPPFILRILSMHPPLPPVFIYSSPCILYHALFISIHPPTHPLFLHSFSIHVHSSSTRPLLILYSSSIRPLSIPGSSSIHPLSIPDSFSVHSIVILYSFSSHPLVIL